MNKKIKIAIAAGLIGAAVTLVVLAFQGAHSATIGVVLGNWPLLILAAVLAASGAFLMDSGATPAPWVKGPFNLARGKTLDRYGVTLGIKRNVRAVWNLPGGGQVRFMERDADFRRRLYMAIRRREIFAEMVVITTAPNTVAHERGSRV